MADANVGNITASLRIDATEWQRGLQTAAAQLAQFQQTLTGVTSTQGTQAASTNQLASAYLAMAQSISQQTSAYTQAQASTLQYRREQDAVRDSLRQQQAAQQQASQAARTAAQAQQQAFSQAAQAARQASQEQIAAARSASTERIAAARAAGQAEILAFRQSVEAARQAAHEQREAMRAAQAASGQGGGILAGALSVAGGLGIVTSISGVVSALKTLTIEAVQAAARMETLRAQFTALQGASQGAATLQGLFTTAQRLGVEFGTLATSFRGFDAATRGTAIEGAQAQKIFEQITTGMRGMGASSEQVGRALLALQQIVSKGTVSQEELRQQLGEALPGAMNIAARALGVTTQELNKMIEKGMDGVAFVKTFANQVDTEFGGKAATATNTLTAAWTRFNNELERSRAVAASGLAGTLRDLTDVATKFLESQRKAREEQIEGLGGPAPVLPREMAEMATLVAKQKEIQALRDFITANEPGQPAGSVGAMFLPTEEDIEKARQRLRVLQKTHEETIKRIQEQWAAEGPTPGEGVVPGARQAEAIRKRYEEGLKELAKIDATAAFVTPLELADEKAKAWRKTMDDIRGITGQIGVGLRSTLVPTGKTTPYDDLIVRIAAEKGIDPNLGRALIEQESRFNPNIVSPKGAKGLTQLMEGTAREMGVPVGKEFDPEANIRGGFGYLAKMIQLAGGDIARALTMYNAGPRGGGIPQATGENATFARDVLRRMPPGTGGVSGGVGGNVGDILASGERKQQSLDIAKQLLVTDEQRAGNLRQQVEGMEQVISRQKAQLISQREGQEAAERFTRLDAARIQAATTEERLARVGLTVGQLKIRDQERLVALQKESAELSAQQETLRAAVMRPQLETQLQGIQAFIGRPDQSLAEQARQQVLRQGTATQAELVKLIQETARHPALQDLQEAFQNALQALPEAVERQSTAAFAAVERQARETLRGMEDQLDQISQRTGAAGLSPFEADLARIRREAARTTDQLEAMVAALEKLRMGATPEAQQAIDVIVGRVKDVQAGQGKALDDALLERQQRAGNQLIEQAESRLAQMRELPGAQGFPFGPPREVVQLRREMRQQEARGETVTEPQRENLRLLEEQMVAQDRLNYAVGIYGQLVDSVAQSWGGVLEAMFAPGEQVDRVALADTRVRLAEARERQRALRQSQAGLQRDRLTLEQERYAQSAVEGSRATVAALEEQERALADVESRTKRVAEAFREMARTMLQSMAEIASQEAFKAIFQLGVGLLTAGLTGGMGAGASSGPSGLGTSSSFIGTMLAPQAGFAFGAQHGAGPITQPTNVLVGEGRTNPEWILNNAQLQSVMTSAVRSGTSGSQGQSPVSIHNYPSKAAAEAGAAQQRAQGGVAVVNAVLDELSTGESSRINRALRSLQR